MSDPIQLRTNGRKLPFVRFDRQELNQILNVYSTRVASGEWRDYAIDQGRGKAVFSIFRSSHEAPTFSILKLPAGSNRRGAYLVMNGPRQLKWARSLTEALQVFERRLVLVSS
ncbi:MAG: DUF2794 domain-containing protein [Acetobacterales bacterium]